MASGGATTDPDRKEAYFLRFDLLIVKEGTAILRARFDHSVPPQTLHQKLNDPDVLKTIKHGLINNFISKSQYNLLYPQGGPPSSEEFDVSLLVYLLRNICGMKTKSKWWHENDNSKIPDTVTDEEADIARIKNMRNQVRGLVNHRLFFFLFSVSNFLKQLKVFFIKDIFLLNAL